MDRKTQFVLQLLLTAFYLVSMNSTATAFQNNRRPARHGGQLEIDLLQRLKIDGSVRRGKAGFHDGVLSLNGTKGASQVVLPAPSAREYDITYHVTRVGGDDYLMLGILFELMPRHICVDKQGDDGHITGLRALQGDQVYFPDEYRGDMLLKKDQKTKIVVRVRNDEVGIEVDGKKIYYFKGRSFKLYLEGSNFFGVEEKLPISIGSWDSQFKIDSIVMSPLRNAEELAWKIDQEKPGGEAKPKESPNSTSKTADKSQKSSNPDQADEKDNPTGTAHSSDGKQPNEKPKPTKIISDPTFETKSIPQIGSFQVDLIDVYDSAVSPDSKLVAIAPRVK